MFRKVLTLTAIILVFSACEVQADVIHSTWDGGGDGRSWEDPYNWNPDIVPDNGGGNTFAVTIDSNSIGVDEVEIKLQQDRTIDTLVCYGEVELQGQPWDWVLLTLMDANGLTNNGVLEISAWGQRLFKIDGNMTNASGAALDLWPRVEIDGDVYNQTGALMEVYGEVDVEGNLENANDAVIIIQTSDGLEIDQQLHNAGEIKIYGGECSGEEVLDNNSTGVIQGFGLVYGGQLLRNKGQIIAYGGPLMVASTGPLLNSGVIRNAPLASLHVMHIAPLHVADIGPPPDVNNSGIIEVNADGGVAFDCNLVNEPNATIQLLGGTLAAANITQSANANFAGFGGITADVVIDPNGIIELTGPTNVVGNMEIGAGATLQISDGRTLITGHTTCNNGTIRMIGGRIIIQGDFTNNNCHIIWEPGTYTNVADFNLDGTVNFKDFADFADTWLWQADWYTP